MAKDKKKNKADTGAVPGAGSTVSAAANGAGTQFQPTAPKTAETAGRKKKTKDAAKTQTGPLTQPNLSSLSPDQVSQLQLEEAIRESQNPAMKLKKLKKPLSVKSCILNLLVFVILTLVLSIAFMAIFKIDNFKLGHVLDDILNKYGIKGFFKKLGNWFSGRGFKL